MEHVFAIKKMYMCTRFFHNGPRKNSSKTDFFKFLYKGGHVSFSFFSLFRLIRFIPLLIFFVMQIINLLDSSGKIVKKSKFLKENIFPLEPSTI